jgi:hypothetical protein
MSDHFQPDGGISDAYLASQLAPEANGGASLDLENNNLTGVETVIPSPDSGTVTTIVVA